MGMWFKIECGVNECVGFIGVCYVLGMVCVALYVLVLFI